MTVHSPGTYKGLHPISLSDSITFREEQVSAKRENFKLTATLSTEDLLAKALTSLRLFLENLTCKSRQCQEGGEGKLNKMYNSHLKNELKLKYILKRVSPFVLVIMVGFLFWWSQMIVATANVPVQVYQIHLK